MLLEELGFNQTLKDYQQSQGLDSFTVGRVSVQHKDRYIVKTNTIEYDAELLGNLRFTVQSANELPVVGDWVAMSEYDDHKALIHSVFPRLSVLERKAVGKVSDTQIIASNIDYALIVQSVNRDYSINRLERYLSICQTSNVEPIIILSKIDLVNENELEALLTNIKLRIKNIPIIALSNELNTGIDELKTFITHGKTYCLLGSSGVGKSTLLNVLIGSNKMETAEISESINRGKHVTTHRELIILESGGIIIDNPGMREIGVTDSSAGFETTFEDIIELADDCKFNDCAHTNEKGCAIQLAINNNEIDVDSYHNFLKMEKEREFFESSIQEKKQKDKAFGKMVKNMKKDRNKNKF